MNNVDVLCLPPHPHLTPAEFEIPVGACDTHAHVIASDAKTYPMVSHRTYTPPAATEEAYLSMLDAQGMSRGVLVQISVYGTDNRYMLEVLRRNRQRLRGVAVISPDISDEDLQAMHLAGVRGARINVLFGGGVGFDVMETLARRIAPLGWHMQFLTDVSRIDNCLIERMLKIPCPGVIDHMGYLPASEGKTGSGFSSLMRLIDGGFWVKLSGANRLSSNFDGFCNVVPVAQAIALSTDRLLWGSDWPHVDCAPIPNTGDLRNQLARWIPNAEQRRRVLVDNPAYLYDFPIVSGS